MRAVVQRVSRARVSVEGERVGAVERGLCVLVGVARDDAEADAATLADKVANMRIFEDDTGRMNLGVKDVGGSVLAVSQFTLLGDMRKGKRPGFGDAMEPACAERLFELFCERVRGYDLRVETGRFRSRMQVELVNEGPVTLLIDTKKAF